MEDTLIHGYRLLVTNPDRLGGKATVAGTRFSVSFITAARRNGLGKLYRRAGNGQPAQEHLTTTITMYREMDMRFWLQQVEAELRQCNDGTKGWTGA